MFGISDTCHNDYLSSCHSVLILPWFIGQPYASTFRHALFPVQDGGMTSILSLSALIGACSWTRCKLVSASLLKIYRHYAQLRKVKWGTVVLGNLSFQIVSLTSNEHVCVECSYLQTVCAQSSLYCTPE